MTAAASGSYRLTSVTGRHVAAIVAGAAVAVAIAWAAGLGGTRGRREPGPPRSAPVPPLPTRALAPPAVEAPRQPRPPSAGEGFDTYSSRPEEDLDLAAASLLLSRDAEPALDPAPVLARLDAWAAEVREVCAAAPDRGAALARFLDAAFGAAGLAFDADDPEGRRPEGLHVHRVLERRQGACLGLSLLVHALADRVGIPARAVALPEHVFLRLDAGGAWRNVEVTAAGAEKPDEEYRGEHRVSPGAVAAGTYLSPVGRRGLLAMLCVNRAAHRLEAGDAAGALRDADRAVRLRERFPQSHANRAAALLALGRPAEALTSAERALALHPGLLGALLSRAEARIRTGDRDGARADAEDAVARAPKDALARTMLGRARLESGDAEGAAREFEAALALSPELSDARRGLEAANRAQASRR